MLSLASVVKRIVLRVNGVVVRAELFSKHHLDKRAANFAASRAGEALLAALLRLMSCANFM